MSLKFNFLFFVAKPAPLRNCTLRPYLTSTYAITMNSTNQTVSNQNYNSHHPQHNHQQQQQQHQQQLNGQKELNRMNTEYMKDRNVFVSTASKTSAGGKNGTINIGKLNKKSLSANGRRNYDDDDDSDSNDDDGDDDDVDVVTTNNDGIREISTKTRRNTKSYNPDNHKKSYLPRTKDEHLNDDDDDGESDIDDYAENEDGNAGNEMTRAFSTVTSNLSYMTSRMDHPKNVKQPNIHHNVKRNLKSWAKGSNGHKTNGDDTAVNDMSFQSDAVAAVSASATTNAVVRGDRGGRGSATLPNPLSSSSRLFSTSTIKSMITASNEFAAAAANGGNDRSRTRNEGHANRNHFDNHKNYNNLKMNGGFGVYKPNAAYLKTPSSVPSEPKSMPSAINNHHLNSNNVIVDSYESPPTTMELECVAGYDGGLPQHFVLEAYDSRTKKLRLNITSAFSDIPLFRIDLAGMCSTKKQKSVWSCSTRFSTLLSPRDQHFFIL